MVFEFRFGAKNEQCSMPCGRGGRKVALPRFIGQGPKFVKDEQGIDLLLGNRARIDNRGTTCLYCLFQSAQHQSGPFESVQSSGHSG